MIDENLAPQKLKEKKSDPDIFSSPAKDSRYWLFAFKIVADFSFVIAVPIVVFVIIGQRLDGKLGIGPWFTILAFFLAFAVSALIIKRKAKKYGEQYMNLDKK